MQKNFDEWNEVKKHIEIKEKTRFCKAREIWWCGLGQNIGDEENGKGKDFRRPILILKKLSKNTSLIVPITKSLKEHKFRIKIGIIKNENASVIMSQIKTIDTKRLSLKIGMIDKNIFEQIKKSFRHLI